MEHSGEAVDPVPASPDVDPLSIVSPEAAAGGSGQQHQPPSPQVSDPLPFPQGGAIVSDDDTMAGDDDAEQPQNVELPAEEMSDTETLVGSPTPPSPQL